MTWLDSSGHSDWLDRKVLKKMRPDVVVSVGFMVVDESSHIVLVSHMSTFSQEGFGNLAIPRGCIQTIVDIEYVS